jgi:hypothetical protein
LAITISSGLISQLLLGTTSGRLLAPLILRSSTANEDVHQPEPRLQRLLWHLQEHVQLPGRSMQQLRTSWALRMRATTGQPPGTVKEETDREGRIAVLHQEG